MQVGDHGVRPSISRASPRSAVAHCTVLWTPDAAATRIASSSNGTASAYAPNRWNSAVSASRVPAPRGSGIGRGGAVSAGPEREQQSVRRDDDGQPGQA